MSSSSYRFSTTTMGEPEKASTDMRTALTAPRPASATSSTRSGAIADDNVTLSPSAAIGDRGPPAPSTSPTSTPSGQRSSSSRSPTVNGGEPSASAAIGGASACAYQRCGGQTSCGVSPVAAASTSASVGP